MNDHVCCQICSRGEHRWGSKCYCACHRETPADFARRKGYSSGSESEQQTRLNEFVRPGYLGDIRPGDATGPPFDQEFDLEDEDLEDFLDQGEPVYACKSREEYEARLRLESEGWTTLPDGSLERDGSRIFLDPETFMNSLEE